MPSNYEQIAEKHRRYYGEGDRHLRIYKRLYSDKTHFIYELVQNADDAGSKTLDLTLRKDGLIVWNDGRPFNESDVRNICSIGFSEKDLTQIGTFGIGFKSVYAYTDNPEVYSGSERFRIRRFVEPEEIRETPAEIEQLINEGRTVFYLPFKENLRSEDVENLRKRLCNLHNWTLLFLRHLETIQWRDEISRREGIYLCSRQKVEDVGENVWKVELMSQVDYDERPLEAFLLFRKEVQPHASVIERLLEQAEDNDERDRINRSAQQPQPIEIAFRLQDGQIVPLEHCVLFAYLPTEKETHLRFLIQARYQTTPARDNVLIDSPWNGWLVRETADFMPEVLRQVKAMGLLKPATFDVFPLDEDNVPPTLQPIAESLKLALKEGEFIPTHSGDYASPDRVFHPHAEDLRRLLTDQDLVELTEVGDARWLHPEIRETKEYRRRFEVVRAAGVREVGASQLISWLSKKGASWLQSKSDEWLCALYKYLSRQKSEMQRIKALPLVRLENGQQVCALEELAFLPPRTDEELEEISPFLHELPIVRASLFEEEEWETELKAFLEELGVKPLNHEEVIREFLLPKYRQTEFPSEWENRKHLQYLRHALDKIAVGDRPKLIEEIKQTPLLLARKGVNGTQLHYIEPEKAYLPQAYTDDPNLETYFAPCSEVWFVDEGYLRSSEDAKNWCEFLKKLGCEDIPQLSKKQFQRNKVGWREFEDELSRRGIRVSWGYADDIMDLFLDGLDEALEVIKNQKSSALNISISIWQLIIHVICRLNYSKREEFLKGKYTLYGPRGGYHGMKEFDATFYRQLKETPWLYDEQGNFHKPAELFAPTKENKQLLGDSVAYLHPEFDLTDKPENEPTRWLAQKLGIHLRADKESVIKYLHSLSGKDVDVKSVENIYRFLDQHGARPEKEFQENALIFTPLPQPRWWKASEVFWENESAVFGEHRGYLKEHYPETLKSFFIAVGVSERAAPLDYVRAIRDITGKGHIDNNVVNRLHILYRRLWHSLQDSSDWQNSQEWKEVYDGKYWLGRKGEEYGFYCRTELVWNDHDYIAKCFEGKIPVWLFEDLTDLAKYLEVKACSQAETDFKPVGEIKPLDEWSKRLKGLSPEIENFLNSPQWSPQRFREALGEILRDLKVVMVEGLQISYSLNGVHAQDPEPRPSYLDALNKTIYLGRDAEEQDYPDLIGDALQDYFGVPELREFVKDLLCGQKEKVLKRWQKRGLSVHPSQPEVKEPESSQLTPTSMPEAEPAETKSTSMPPQKEEDKAAESISKPQQPDADKKELLSKPTPMPLPKEAKPVGEITPAPPEITPVTEPKPPKGQESEKHRNLKEHLAENPNLFGLTLKGETEYEFPSGDRVDILFKDEDGKPLAVVEVEIEFPQGDKRFSSVWQAVKYKHLAAVEAGIPCDKMRSILVAPKIPDDVRQECNKYGVEPKEVVEPKKEVVEPKEVGDSL